MSNYGFEDYGIDSMGDFDDDFDPMDDFDSEDYDYEPDDSMDGDFDSAMGSAGFGYDEQYDHFEDLGAN